jgi:hypothetical protein
MGIHIFGLRQQFWKDKLGEEILSKVVLQKKKSKV